MAINIPLITDYDGRGVKKAEKAFANLGKSTKALGSSLKSVFLPAAAAVGAFAAVSFSAVKAAVEDQAAQALLAKQLQNSTKATKAQVAATEKFISTLSLATGVADDELRPAMAGLVRVTKNTGKAQKLLRVALNVSKGTGKSLATVVQSLARAYGGNVKALAKLDPSLKAFIGKTTTADQATARLAKNFAGSAKAAADTYAGRLDRMNVAFAEAKEALGMALLPVLERFVSFIAEKVIPYVDKLVAKLEQDGLSGAFKMAAGDAKNFSDNADGTTGTLINLGATAGILFGIFKGFNVFTATTTAVKALGAALESMGGIFVGVSSSSLGVIATAIGLIVANIYVLISALRDPAFRSDFGRFLSDSFKLVANSFIFLYKVIQEGLNAIARFANKILPGTPFGQLPSIDFLKFSQDQQAPAALVPRQGESAMGGVTINVNGGDPQATVDAITRWYRQNGATVAWMR